MKYYTCIKSKKGVNGCYYHEGSTYKAECVKHFLEDSGASFMAVFAESDLRHTCMSTDTFNLHFKENSLVEFSNNPTLSDLSFTSVGNTCSECEEWKSIEEDGFPEGDGLYFARAANGILGEALYRPSEIKYHGFPYYCLAKIPEFKENPKTLTFPEALRVVLDGGKVRKRNWGEGSFIFIKGNHIAGENGDDYFFCDSDYQYSGWIIVEPAPKPKVPEKLKDFKDALFRTKFVWLPRYPGDALCKLSSLLDDYSHK